MKTQALVPAPAVRKLRIYAFDPSLSSKFETAHLNKITVPVLWEEILDPGPVGEYIEVVDADPSSAVFYHPVDLNERWILAQDGIAPSETNPLFHQQMVYAVAMTTIGHFEQALGRVALWSSRRGGPDGSDMFVRRLRIYPHALRDRNAYYSAQHKALLFGYFPVGIRDAHNTPGTIVFTCLSHDIIAHETTHALLDGVHPRFTEPVNRDVRAFHEAFADIVALFQHFAYPGVLREEIARTRGNLASETLLAQLAQEFGRASGRGGALRDALGARNEHGQWQAHRPDPKLLDTETRPHERGAILVAAVFGAFEKVYRSRVADLLRIASEGTGLLRDGDIPHDLAARLADEAARIAASVLQMCIRAIDYCPPCGITFGDYLRALITGDAELNPEDPGGSRVAFVDSFRQWGIHPTGMRSMSQEALLWPTFAEVFDKSKTGAHAAAELKDLFEEDQPVEETDSSDEDLDEAPYAHFKGRSSKKRLRPWNLETDRYETWLGAEDNATVFWTWLVKGKGDALCDAFGLLTHSAKPTVFRSRKNGRPAVEVHSVRTALRRGPRGGPPVTDLVVEVTQRRRGYFDKAKQHARDSGLEPVAGKGDFIYRAGCTLIIDPVSFAVRRVIRTAGTIDDDAELERMRRFIFDGADDRANAFSSARDVVRDREPFAMLHRGTGGL